MCKALVFISKKEYSKAIDELNYLINFLENNIEDDDKTGIGTLAAAYANRGIIKDREKKYKEALQDYIKALGIDHVAVAGPGLGTIILNYKFKSSSVKERALYLNEQLQLPEEERVLSIEEVEYFINKVELKDIIENNNETYLEKKYFSSSPFRKIKYQLILVKRHY